MTPRARLPGLSSAWTHRVAVLTALALVALVYAPGLSGSFLFDDFINLRTLGSFGPVDNPQTLLYYLTSGIADPTGRPVSLATFLLDARDWPADPFPFKRSNLILHLLNGVLLIAVLRRLEGRLRDTPHALPNDTGNWIALLAGLLWLAHPLFVSTTLYVVQRHAMLPLAFVLLALLCWDVAYGRLRDNRPSSGLAWSIVGVGGCSLLAGLSKANGFLAPLLALVAVLVLYRPDLALQPRIVQRHTRWTAGIVLGVPATLIVCYLISFVPGNLDYAGTRAFTLGERLLTQPRALFDYLGLLLLPRAGGGGVFVEHYAASKGLLDPWITLPAILGILGLSAAAVALVGRMPVLSFAVLFYFAAHLMESSTIMLELYFEHRNYLPAAFLFWPLARWLIAGRQLLIARRILTVALPVLLLALTWQRSLVWGDPNLLATLSATQNPDSARAQMIAAIQDGSGGAPEEAAQRLRAAIARSGLSTELALNLIGQECRVPQLGLSSDTLSLTGAAFAQEQNWHLGIIGWLTSALDYAAQETCPGLDLDAMESLLSTAAKNPSATSNPTRKQNLLHLQGHLALLRQTPDQALALFNQALEASPNVDTALTQAAMLGNLGHPALGARHLGYYLDLPAPDPIRVRDMRSLHSRILHDTGYYRREAEQLRRALQDGASAPTGATQQEVTAG